VASVAEVKAAIDAAWQQGSGHDAVSAARAALTRGATELDDALSAMHHAVEQARSYAAAL
jgi:hypothetical protein